MSLHNGICISGVSLELTTFPRTRDKVDETEVVSAEVYEHTDKTNLKAECRRVYKKNPSIPQAMQLAGNCF